MKHQGWKTLLKRSWPPVWSIGFNLWSFRAVVGWVLTLLPVLFSPMFLFLFWGFNLSSAQAKRTWVIWEGLVSVTLLWAWTLIMEPVWYGHGLAARGMEETPSHSSSLFFWGWDLKKWSHLKWGVVSIIVCCEIFLWSLTGVRLLWCVQMCRMMHQWKPDECCNWIASS